MKTLVIHPQDKTTDFLKIIYEGRGWTEVTDPKISKKCIKESIKSHDRIIMLGHGTELGLVDATEYYNHRYYVDSSLVSLLKGKELVGVWCNANVFFEKYDLKGFYTGMIISEYEEALMYSISTNNFFLEESNKDFAKAIKESIDNKNMLEKVKELYEGNSPIVVFNRENLFIK